MFVHNRNLPPTTGQLKLLKDFAKVIKKEQQQQQQEQQQQQQQKQQARLPSGAIVTLNDGDQITCVAESVISWQLGIS